jgi:hypothetical protein
MLLVLVVSILVQPFASVLSIHQPFVDKPIMRDLLDILADFVKKITQIYGGDHIYVANVVRQIVYVVLATFLLPFLFINMAVFYFSYKEQHEAISMKAAFRNFGKRNKYQETRTDEK